MNDIEMDELRGAVRRAVKDFPGVAAVYVYGSRATGRHTPSSDLDLAILPGADAAPTDPLLAERLGSRVAAELGGAFEPDAHLTDDLPLPVLGRVLTTGVLVHDADPPRRVVFETSTRSLYFDFAPLLERDAREGIISGG